MLYVLLILARIAASRGDLERAGRLLGAAEAERARLGGSFRGEAVEIVAPLLERAEPALVRGRDEGRRLPLDDAVRYALGDAVPAPAR